MSEPKKQTERNKIEEYFEWWLHDMVDAGYIISWSREPETFQVLGTSEYCRMKRFKTKSPVHEVFNLFQEISYTYDYLIVWAPSAEYLFYEEINEQGVFQFGKPPFVAHSRQYDDGTVKVISYIDVKPTSAVAKAGGKVSSSTTFPIKQRILWDTRKIYINKCVPIPMAGTGFTIALFPKVFTPRRYIFTDGGGRARKIHFKVRTLEAFVTRQKTYIENLMKNTAL
jgi:hypothetical protein